MNEKSEKPEITKLVQAKKARQDAFLEEYKLCATITHAAKIALISRRRHYKWLESDPEYAKAFEEAEIAATDSLVAEARRRATQGVEESVYYQGEVVGTIRKYSDTLLIFLLKGALPEVYRERYEISGGDKPLRVKSDPGREALTDETLRKLIAVGEEFRRIKEHRGGEEPQQEGILLPEHRPAPA